MHTTCITCHELTKTCLKKAIFEEVFFRFDFNIFPSHKCMRKSKKAISMHHEIYYPRYTTKWTIKKRNKIDDSKNMCTHTHTRIELITKKCTHKIAYRWSIIFCTRNCEWVETFKTYRYQNFINVNELCLPFLRE